MFFLESARSRCAPRHRLSWSGTAYLTADRLRTVIRTYIEALNAIRLRPTGGV